MNALVFFFAALAEVQVAVLSVGWFSNRTGTSFDDGKARGKDYTRLPVHNLPLSHWSSQLFYLRATSSTDVPVLLLNQPGVQSSTARFSSHLSNRVCSPLLFASDMLCDSTGDSPTLVGGRVVWKPKLNGVFRICLWLIARQLRIPNR